MGGPEDGRVRGALTRLAGWLRAVESPGAAQPSPTLGSPVGTGPDAASQAPRVLTRWQAPGRITVLLVAVVLLAVQAALLTITHDVVVGVALALATAHAFSAPMALWRPVSAAGLSLVAFTLQALVLMPAGLPGWPWAIAPQVLTQLLVLLVLTLAAGWRLAGGTLLVQLLVGVVLAVVGMAWNGLVASLGYVALFAALAGLVGSLAAVSGRLVEIREALRRERTISAEEQARRTVVEEKSRIARELHDVIAHNMSLITVQARSAPHRVAEVSDAAAAEFGDIADRAAEALGQMRGVLDVLRTEPGQSGLVPVPRLDGLAALVEAARATGQRVDVYGAPPPADRLGPDVSAAAYRILQEALSNARRHAPDAAVRVDLVVGDTEFEVRVANALDGPPKVGTDGHGVVGMRERASSVGGRVTAGPAPAEGSAGPGPSGPPVEYVVVGRLPMRLPARRGQEES